MAPERPADFDSWPWAVTALAMTVAIAMNIALANLLWLGYSLVGATVVATLFFVVRWRRLAVPSLAVWMVGVAAALHYIGGSLSGLHQIGGPNGLYYAFPWWDNVVHFLGSWAVGVAAAALLIQSVPAPRVRVFVAACIACTVGVVVELYEFVQFVFFDTIDQGFYTNTLLDLYYNLLGGTAGAVVYVTSAESG